MCRRTVLRLPDLSVIELSQLQLERAKQTLLFIPSHIDIGDCNTAINRSYYAAFYAMKAVEILDGFDSKKHSGVISYFRNQYIRNGIFDKKLSKIIGRLSEIREQSDYNMTAVFDLQTARELYELSKEFVYEIDKYLTAENINRHFM